MLCGYCSDWNMLLVLGSNNKAESNLDLRVGIQYLQRGIWCAPSHCFIFVVGAVMMMRWLRYQILCYSCCRGGAKNWDKRDI